MITIKITFTDCIAFDLWLIALIIGTLTTYGIPTEGGVIDCTKPTTTCVYYFQTSAISDRARGAIPGVLCDGANWKTVADEKRHQDEKYWRDQFS